MALLRRRPRAPSRRFIALAVLLAAGIATAEDAEAPRDERVAPPPPSATPGEPDRPERTPPPRPAPPDPRPPTRPSDAVRPPHPSKPPPLHDRRQPKRDLRPTVPAPTT